MLYYSVSIAFIPELLCFAKILTQYRSTFKIDFSTFLIIHGVWNPESFKVHLIDDNQLI